MALGYEVMQNVDRTLVWAKACYLGLTPKINIFFWVMLQNRILTVDNLIKRGQKIPNRCILCKNHCESVDHLFLHCDFTRQVCGLFFYLFSIYHGVLLRIP